MTPSMLLTPAAGSLQAGGEDLGDGSAAAKMVAAERLPTDAGVGAYVDLITPSNATDIPNGPPRALLVMGAGNVALQVLNTDGETRLDLPVAAVTLWQLIPFAVYRVLATGTTATLYGIW